MSDAFNDLLAAAKAVYSQIGNHAPAHIRHVVTPNQRDNLRDAIAAAEREAAELAEPIDDEWLSTIARQSADGWVINAQLTVWYGEHCHEWLAMHTGAGTAIKLDGGREQLLSLLRGLGIEVAK